MMNEKLIVALDVAGAAQAQTLVKNLSGVVKFYKVGKELFTSCGPEVVKLIQENGGRVFLDLKFHDIPHTVAQACRAAARLGVAMLNVHACGGKNMLYAAAQAVHQEAARTPGPHPLVLGVTVLTSLTDADLKETGVKGKVKAQVQRLALLCQQCGLDGVVASGQEIEVIRRSAGKNFLIVTPGVRPVWAARGDQKRIITPREAIEKGADFIVMGRPITEHASPRQAAEKVLREMS